MSGQFHTAAAGHPAGMADVRKAREYLNGRDAYKILRAGRILLKRISIKRNGRCDRLCGLVVKVPGYRSRDRGSISGRTRFCENTVRPASRVQLRSYLKEKNSFSGLEIREYGLRDPPR
jgi:hypothetical protein